MPTIRSIMPQRSAEFRPSQPSLRGSERHTVARWDRRDRLSVRYSPHQDIDQWQHIYLTVAGDPLPADIIAVTRSLMRSAFWRGFVLGTSEGTFCGISYNSIVFIAAESLGGNQ
jgi:hypothetical protein